MRIDLTERASRWFCITGFRTWRWRPPSRLSIALRPPHVSELKNTGLMRQEMGVVYRARHFIPAPLEAVEPLWLKFS